MAFEVKDCTLISRMAGIDTALNLRELRERLKTSPVECLFHHFCETVIRPAFDDPEYRNDFAVWAARDLRDKALAERLGIINPYAFPDFETLRSHVVDIIDDHLATVDHIPWVEKGADFRFMQAVTVVFETDRILEKPADLRKELHRMSLSSVYYHFVEARRRTDNREDDLSAWLINFDDTQPLIDELQGIDFYFLTLEELKQRLINTVEDVLGTREHQHEKSA